MRYVSNFELEPFRGYAGFDEFERFDAELADEWEGEVNRNSPTYIRWVQNSLNRILGLGLVVDGVAGPQTRSAIRSFQQRMGLVADGVVGPKTEAALITAGAPRPTGTSGSTSSSPSCPPRPTNVDCPPPDAKPFEVLDNFTFDRADLNRSRHGPRIASVARRVVDSQRSRQPIRSVKIAGHTDPVGSDDYNFDLAWRRAKEVMGELCRAIESLSPGLARRLKFELTSCGERQQKPRPEESRRVEIFIAASDARRQKPVPPDDTQCGIPSQTLQSESEMALEIRELERAAQARRVQPRLSMFQNTSVTSHRNHFHCQAARWAGRIAAFASPNVANCRQRRVGPTPYDTGADIIRAIEAARTCLGRRIEAVHIFSHGSSHGIPGTVRSGTVGLYSGALDADSRRDGGRVVADIPTAPLSENVVFVLHGCNMAAGDDNFARALYEHLVGSLRNPTVFGHFNRGCAGRDNSWREYSNRSPDGRRRLRTIAPTYQGDGCCTPSRRRVVRQELNF